MGRWRDGHVSRYGIGYLGMEAGLDLGAELGPVAAASGRTKSWLINDALRSYVTNEQQFLAAVEEGRQALKEGRVIAHDTVVAAFERLIAHGA